jgi:AcrR family transcriptional regulator
MKKKYTAEEARLLILNTATTLCLEKGYEQTSISDIVSGLDGLTKGAVYHHFDSKYDILIEIVNTLVPKKELLEEIDTNKNLNGLEKIQTLFLEAMFQPEIASQAIIISGLLEDPIFTSLYNKQICYYLAPKIESYIIEGNQDGSIETTQPEEMAEIIILLISTWFIQSLFVTTSENFLKKLTAAKFVLKSSGIDVLSDDVLQKIKNNVSN